MAKKTAPPPIDISDAISNGLAEQAALEQQKVRQQAVLDQLESERASIHSDMQQCAQSRESIKAKIATTQRETEKQEGYVSLWKGASGISEMQALKSTMEALLDQLHHLMSHDAAMTTRAAELDTLIAASRTDLAAVSKHIETVASARARLREEHSAALADECHNVTSERERHAQALREELAAVEQEIVTAREASLQRLSPYPSERRRFEAEHHPSDATIEVLKAGILFFTTLVDQGHAAEQCQAGVPAAVISLLREFELDAATLGAVASGEPHVLVVQRDRLIAVLRDYLHKWTAAAS